MTPDEYWRSGAGLSNITPQGKEWPEGEWFKAWLEVNLISRDVNVLEVGCGPGRLARLFHPADYLGLDICPDAIARAREAAPGHLFMIDDGLPYPAYDVTLFHTVLLHVPDHELRGVISRITGGYVLVSEILGRHLRRPGLPPVFNREAQDYEAAFAPHYRLVESHSYPYVHYKSERLSILEFVRC